MKNLICLILIYFAYYFGWQSGTQGKELFFDWHYFLDKNNYTALGEWIAKYF